MPPSGPPLPVEQLAGDDEPTRRRRAARAIEEFLGALGYALDGELAGTGQRVADAWFDDLVSGERVDPAKLLHDGSLDLGDGPHAVVVVRDIAVATMCPHHLMPSHGVATIGYQPRRHAAGLGAIAQAAHASARRLTLQETMCAAIAASLMDGLDAVGSFCRLSLVHTCFVARGERQSGSVVETLALRGVFDGPQRDVAVALAHGAALPREAAVEGGGGKARREER